MTPIFKICQKTAFLVSGVFFLSGLRTEKKLFYKCSGIFKSGQIVCLRPYRAPQGIKVLGKYHLKVKICTRRPQSKLDCENLVSGKNACFFKFSKEGPISWLIKTLCILKPFFCQNALKIESSKLMHNVSQLRSNFLRYSSQWFQAGWNTGFVCNRERCEASCPPV